MNSSHPLHLRIFLSSPGDVTDERSIAHKIFENIQYDPLLRGKVTLEIVAWDKAGSDTPLLATMTPQEAINLGLPKPSECDICITIFWSRLGTPLPDTYKKTDGSRYLSGTEWEYEDAMASARATGKPLVVVYRRIEKVLLDPDDPNFNEKLEQKRRVDKFFASFTNEDGSIGGGINFYNSPDDFRAKIEAHLKSLIQRLVETQSSATASNEVKNKSQIAEHHFESPPLWEGSPFPGLRAFTPKDAPIFYGRGSETDALIKRLSNPATKLIAIVGASGSGKSSLVGAGLLPRLGADAIPGSRDWVSVRFTPGSARSGDPFEALGIALREVISVPESLIPHLALWQDETVETLLKGRQPWSELILFIDQFEELFTLVHSSFIARFIFWLGRAVETPRVRIILTLRSDFYPKCLETMKLTTLLKDTTYPLAAPEREALYEMITYPADRAGLQFEENLVKRILDDTGSDAGALALMAYALDELYHASQDDKNLSHVDYEAIGTVQGAIGKRAESIYQNLSDEAKNSLSSVFRELMELDERGVAIRRRSPLTQVTRTQASRQLVNALINSRLLITSQQDGQPIVEVAHEALLKNWERLASWIETTHEELHLLRQVRVGAADWERGGKKQGELLTGLRLEKAAPWLTTDTLGTLEREFIKASLDEENRKKNEAIRIARRVQNFQRATITLAVFVLLAAGVAIFAGIEAQNAADEIQRANQRLTPIAQQLEAENTQVAIAQNQAFTAFETLTPIPSTLTPMAATLQIASTEIAAIEPTLDFIADELDAEQKRSTSRRLADAANDMLQIQDGNSETGVLLSIKALQTAYTTQADTALVTLLDRLYTREIFLGHDDSVNIVAYSPDGNTALTGSSDATVRLWDVETGEEIRQFAGHTDEIKVVAYSRDGQMVMAGGSDGTVRVWSTNSGSEIQVFEFPPETIIIGGSFSPDGKYIITGGTDSIGRLWNIATGDEIRQFVGHEDDITSAIFSTDGNHILTASRDTTARLWDTQSGEEIQQFVGHEATLWSATFSPDGRVIATSSSDGTIRLWETNSGQEIRTMEGYQDGIPGVVFSPSGNQIASAGWSGVAKLWNVETGELIKTFSGHFGSVESIAFAPNGEFILTGSDDNTARLWEINPAPRRYLEIPDTHIIAVFSTFEKQLALIETSNHEAQLWEVDPAGLVQTFQGHTDTIQVATLSADGQLLVTGSQDGSVKLWETSSGQYIREFKGHTDAITSAVISEDARLVATASRDYTLRLWDMQTGNEIRQFEGYEEPIISIAFSPDGQSLAAGSEDATAWIWNVQTAEEMIVFEEHTRPVSSIAFSPDSQLIVTGSYDDTARVWNAITGENIHWLIGHTDSVASAIFNPDGKYILTGSDDGFAILWDTVSGTPVRQFNGHTESIHTAVFSTDGRYIVTGSRDDTARKWDSNYRDFVTYACTFVFRDFGEDERRNYLLDNTMTCPHLGR